MALSTVTLKWNLADLIQSGLSATLSITPTAQMTDSADHELIPPVARTVNFIGGAGQLAGIVANDNASILPAYNPPAAPGAGYLISVATAAGAVIVPQFQTQILFSNGAVQWLDALAVVPAVATAYQFVPLPGTPPAAGQVLGWDGTETDWVDQSGGGGGMTNPMTVLGDTIYGASGGTPARLAGNTSATRKFLRETGTGSAAAAPAWDTLVAGDIPAIAESQVTNLVADLAAKAPLASPVFTGTPAAPTPTAADSSTKLATTSFVGTAIGNLGLGSAATRAASDFDAAGLAAAETTRAEAAEGTLTAAVAGKVAKAGDTMAGYLAPKAVTLTDGSSVAIDASAGNVFDWPLGGSSHTLAAPGNPVDGDLIVLRIGYSGSFTPLFNAVFDFNGSAPTWTAAAGKEDEAAFRYRAASSKWRYQGSMLGFTS